MQSSISAEYQPCDGAPTREWVLTDLADSSQLGTSQRVEEKVMKMWKMNQATPTIPPVAASGGGELLSCQVFIYRVCDHLPMYTRVLRKCFNSIEYASYVESMDESYYESIYSLG